MAAASESPLWPKCPGGHERRRQPPSTISTRSGLTKRNPALSLGASELSSGVAMSRRKEDNA
jgi:hypothetical protein